MGVDTALLYGATVNEIDEDCIGEKGICMEEIRNILLELADTEDEKKRIYLYSKLLLQDKRLEWLLELEQLILDSRDLPWDTLYFLFGQIGRMIFMDPALETEESVCLKWRILEKALEKCKQEISQQLEAIPIFERDQNLVVMIIEQFLGYTHGPTKTVLDRSLVVKKELGKKVLIINTAELMSLQGYIPFEGVTCASYMPELTELEYCEWKGERFSYFQCEQDMPNLPVLEMLLQTMRQLKPGMVICVGGGSLFAGLVNEMIPVLTVGTTQSGLYTTMADYQVVNNALNAMNQKIVERMKRKKNHVIEGRFTFSLKAQQEHVTRAQLGLPEDTFLLALVGGRLNEEMSEEFLQMLDEVLEEQIQAVFIGIEEVKNLQSYQNLQKYAYCLGFCGDVLSRLEICDLYVNPIRKGGATSSVEALYKKKPILTTGFGDVGGVAEDIFVCKDLTDMKEQILRYSQDAEFYSSQSALAEKQAEKYMGSTGAFVQILEEYQRRMNL